MDGLAKLIEALAQVLKAVAWPGLVAIVVWQFKPSIRAFLDNVSEASFKGLGIEASAKRQQAVAAIVAADLAKTEGNEADVADKSPSERVLSSFRTANSLVTRGVLRRALNKNVLWVDDNPDNNLWERKALQSLGLNVTPVTSTESALRALDAPGPYDLIISDMTRGADKMAGYDLLERVRRRSWRKPFIIYAGSASPEQERTAIERGATGRASDPEKLIRAVVDALKDEA